MKSIVFIGCGNMARPIIARCVSQGVFAPENIYVYDISPLAADFCRETGVVFTETLGEGVERADAVLLAVKPQVLPSLLPEIAPMVNGSGKTLISIAAGKTTDYIASFFTEGTPVARIFPNLCASVGAAVSAYCGNASVTPDALEKVRETAASIGEAYALDEEYFAIFGVLGGCGPAYAFMFIKALADAAENAGLDPGLARLAAAGMVEGAAKLLKTSDAGADDLVRRVCSPGGTTIEGVNSLKNDGLSDTVARAFKASLDRDAELAKG